MCAFAIFVRDEGMNNSGQALIEAIVTSSFLIFFIGSVYTLHRCVQLKFDVMLVSRNKILGSKNGGKSWYRSVFLKAAESSGTFKNPFTGKKGTMKNVYKGVF